MTVVNTTELTFHESTVTGHISLGISTNGNSISYPGCPNMRIPKGLCGHGWSVCSLESPARISVTDSVAILLIRRSLWKYVQPAQEAY